LSVVPRLHDVQVEPPPQVAWDNFSLRPGVQKSLFSRVALNAFSEGQLQFSAQFPVIGTVCFRFPANYRTCAGIPIEIPTLALSPQVHLPICEDGITLDLSPVCTFAHEVGELVSFVADFAVTSREARESSPQDPAYPGLCRSAEEMTQELSKLRDSILATAQVLFGYQYTNLASIFAGPQAAHILQETYCPTSFQKILRVFQFFDEHLPAGQTKTQQAPVDGAALAVLPPLPKFTPEEGPALESAA
jgi:hypothetical protein